MAVKPSDFKYDVTTYLSDNYIRMAGYHRIYMRRERLEPWIKENTFIVTTADLIDEDIKNNGYYKAKDAAGNSVSIVHSPEVIEFSKEEADAIRNMTIDQVVNIIEEAEKEAIEKYSV